MNENRMVRVANAQGFWGDSLLGPMRLVEEGPVDYLTFDYLAEITMSIMQKQKMRKPDAGYAMDFILMLEKILPACKEKGIKIVANAGGVNPRACLEATQKVIRELGLSGIRIGIVEGDDILDRLDEIIGAGEKLANMDTDESLATIRDRITSRGRHRDYRSRQRPLTGGSPPGLRIRLVNGGLRQAGVCNCAGPYHRMWPPVYRR